MASWAFGYWSIETYTSRLAGLGLALVAVLSATNNSQLLSVLCAPVRLSRSTCLSLVLSGANWKFTVADWLLRLVLYPSVLANVSGVVALQAYKYGFLSTSSFAPVVFFGSRR